MQNAHFEHLFSRSKANRINVPIQEGTWAQIWADLCFLYWIWNSAFLIQKSDENTHNADMNS